MDKCLFCSIADHSTPADIVSENDDILVIKDIQPKAKIHLLVIPKKHIPSITELEEADGGLAGKLIIQAKREAETAGVDKDGYKLIFNVGEHGGQAIPHVHLHLLGGEPLGGIT